jgi:copper chaperone CopZ
VKEPKQILVIRIREMRFAMLLLEGILLFSFTGCGPNGSTSSLRTTNWNLPEYGPEPERQSLSKVEVSTEKSWIVARERDAVPSRTSVNSPKVCTAHFHVGGMDCGDCQRLVVDEVASLAGVRQARVSQFPPETVVEYDSSRLSAKQIEGTLSTMGLWPKPLP